MLDGSQEDDKARMKTRPVGGLLLALGIPAAGYLITYMHEMGYLRAFNIPSAFITVDLITVLQVTLALAGALTFPFVFGNAISMLWPEGRLLSLNGVRILKSLALALIGIALVVFWPQRREIGIFFLIAGAFYALMDFAVPILGRRGKRPYREKLKEADEIDEGTKSLVDRLASSIGAYAFILVSAAIVLSAFSYYRGLYTADHKTHYLMRRTSSDDSTVVLREYHDRLICAYVDVEHRQLGEGFFVLSVVTDDPAVLVVSDIGPLSLWKAPVVQSGDEASLVENQRQLPTSPVQTQGRIMKTNGVGSDQQVETVETHPTCRPWQMLY
jgi:hypothetical protein